MNVMLKYPMVSKEKDDGSANKSSDALKKVGDKAPPDTDATRPCSTLELALKKVGDKAPPDTDATRPLSTPSRQAQDLQAHLSVFSNGHRGPSGDRLLAEMELELLKRGTE